jgi:hypothetical protein
VCTAAVAAVDAHVRTAAVAAVMLLPLM